MTPCVLNLLNMGVDYTIIRGIIATLKGRLSTATLVGFSRTVGVGADHRVVSCHRSYGALFLMN